MVQITISLCVLVTLSVMGCRLEAIPLPDDSPTSNSTGEWEEEVNSCPGYSIGKRKGLGCPTGTRLGIVSHIEAFRFKTGSEANWSSCAIPTLPEGK